VYLDRPGIHRNRTRTGAHSGFARLVELREIQAVLAGLHDAIEVAVAGGGIPHFKAAQSLVNVERPGSVVHLIGHRLAKFPVVDDVDAGFDLLANHFIDRAREPRGEFCGRRLIAVDLDKIGGPWQAAHVSRKDAIHTVLHVVQPFGSD